MANAIVARLVKMFRDNPATRSSARTTEPNGALLAAESKISAAIEAVQEEPQGYFFPGATAFPLSCRWGITSRSSIPPLIVNAEKLVTGLGLLFP
jgi:hypothetical protein